jgi:hypothetical protein
LLTIQTDLTNDSAAEEITKATRARFGRIDGLRVRPTVQYATIAAPAHQSSDGVRFD